MKNDEKDIFSIPILNTDDVQSHQDVSETLLPQDRFIPPEVPDDPLRKTVSDGAETEQPHKEQVEAKSVLHSGKYKKKRRKGDWQHRYRLFVILAIILVFLLWLFLRFSPVSFGNVIVDGNSTMSNEAVYRSCGIVGPVNVVQLSPDTMKDNLSNDLRVARVEVVREFPATIHVTIEERKPIAVMTTMYGFAYLDANGVVIQLGQRIKGISVPLFTGKKMDTLLLGDVIKNGPVRDSLTYLQNLSPEYLNQVAEVNVGNPDKITVYTSDSIPIYLGNGDHPEQRAHITEELLQEVKNNRLSVAYIDSDVQAPLVKSK